jgi:hypothetical protein
LIIETVSKEAKMSWNTYLTDHIMYTGQFTSTMFLGREDGSVWAMEGTWPEQGPQDPRLVELLNKSDLHGEILNFCGVEYLIGTKTGLAYELRSEKSGRGALAFSKVSALIGLCDPKKPETGEPLALMNNLVEYLVSNGY